MIYTAEIIKDSVSPAGVRLTTMQLTYPRFIHAEFMTHRVFSRNASSSRAIPVKKLLEMVRAQPAMFVEWGANKPGMQAAEVLPPEIEMQAKATWVDAMEAVAGYADKMLSLDPAPHKQIVNRMLEPWVHISVIVTATEWSNFFKLRLDAAAQPEIQLLAQRMKEAMDGSTPEPLKHGDWHLPYILQEDVEDVTRERPKLVTASLCRISAARCARVSYLTHDGKRPTIEADLKLAHQLISMYHDSPLEHIATPSYSKVSPLNGNLRGWDQYRKLIENLRSGEAYVEERD